MRKKFILLALAMMLLWVPSVFAQSLFYADNPSSIATASGSQISAGNQLITGQCNLQSITVSGPHTTALDYLLLYDNTSATGTPKWDISIGTAGDTVFLKLNDSEIATGLYVDAPGYNSGFHISVEYTQ
jgi:hypothetical protein